jgi:hypothetical protein
VRGAGALVAVVLVLLLAGVAVDAYLTDRAEDQAAQRVSAELGGQVEVDLRGWPVSLRLLQGRVPEVAISAREVPLEGSEARLERLETVVRDVRVRFADLSGTDALPVDGGAGTFRADISEASVNALAVVPGGVRLGEGVAVVDVGGQPVEVLATVDAGQVVLRPAQPGAGLAPIPLPLPPLPGEVVVEGVSVAPGILTLVGRVERLVR